MAKSFLFLIKFPEIEGTSLWYNNQDKTNKTIWRMKDDNRKLHDEPFSFMRIGHGSTKNYNYSNNTGFKKFLKILQ